MLARSIVVLGLSAASLWCGSCSVLFDLEEQQCAADADCAARGLPGSVCVANVCQQAQAATAAGSGGASAPIDAGATRSPDAASPPRSPSRAPSESGAGAAGSEMVPPSDSGGRAGAGGTSSGAAGSSSAAPADAGVSEPQSCADGGTCCSVAEDCERAGIAGGICADSVCWPVSDQCSADDECTTRGPEFEGGRCLEARCVANPRWRCELPEPVAPTGEQELSVLVRDSLSLNGVPDVLIVACAKLDPLCENPIAEAKTGSDGILKITVPNYFAGYLQQTARTDYAPALYFLPPVFPADGVLQPFPLLGAGANLETLAATLGASLDPERGHMMLIAEDCMGAALPGVSFSSPQQDDVAVRFYVQDILPDTSATQTAAAGNGGYLNMPPGTVAINVTRLMPELDLATVSVYVRAGYITVVYIRPQSR